MNCAPFDLWLTALSIIFDSYICVTYIFLPIIYRLYEMTYFDLIWTYIYM